ncbi:hypothetical protein R6Q57_012465 [Mikania cordata]
MGTIKNQLLHVDGIPKPYSNKRGFNKERDYSDSNLCILFGNFLNQVDHMMISYQFARYVLRLIENCCSMPTPPSNICFVSGDNGCENNLPKWEITGLVEYIHGDPQPGGVCFPVAVRLENEATISQTITVKAGSLYAMTFGASRTCTHDEVFESVGATVVRWTCRCRHCTTATVTMCTLMDLGLMRPV